jgi:hypothetical protein
MFMYVEILLAALERTAQTGNTEAADIANEAIAAYQANLSPSALSVANYSGSDFLKLIATTKIGGIRRPDVAKQIWYKWAYAMPYAPDQKPSMKESEQKVADWLLSTMMHSLITDNSHYKTKVRLVHELAKSMLIDGCYIFELFQETKQG